MWPRCQAGVRGVRLPLRGSSGGVSGMPHSPMGLPPSGAPAHVSEVHIGSASCAQGRLLEPTSCGHAYYLARLRFGGEGCAAPVRGGYGARGASSHDSRLLSQGSRCVWGVVHSWADASLHRSLALHALAPPPRPHHLVLDATGAPLPPALAAACAGLHASLRARAPSLGSGSGWEAPYRGVLPPQRGRPRWFSACVRHKALGYVSAQQSACSVIWASSVAWGLLPERFRGVRQAFGLVGTRLFSQRRGSASVVSAAGPDRGNYT